MASVAASDPRSRATSPTSPPRYSSQTSNIYSPVAARAGTMASVHAHTRSASTQLPMTGHRSTTPAVRTASVAPASPVRPELKTRRQSVSTPSPLKMVRSTSSGSTSDEILVPRVSLSQRDHEREKQKNVERERLIQRWLPNLETSSPPSGGRLASYFSSSTTTAPRPRTTSAASAAFTQPSRYKTPVPTHS